MKKPEAERGRLAAGMASRLRAMSPARMLNATVPKRGVEVTEDVAYGDLPLHRLDIYRPVHAAPDLPVVVFFHGGGWRAGRKAVCPFLALTMARAGAVVVVPNYRLYPEVRYPDFLADCAAATAWVQAHAAETGTGKLFLMGHSAGAYNAVMLGLDRDWLQGAGADPDRVSGVIGLAGPYDFLPIRKPAIRRIFPDAGPRTQPVTYARADAPPLLLLTGSNDNQVKPRNAQALADRMHEAGGRARVITYRGVGHIGLITAVAPAFSWRAPVLRDVMAFVGARAVM